MSLPLELMEIERQLWTNDAALYERHLIEDARLAFAETGVISRTTAVNEVRRENEEGRRWADVQLSEVNAVGLGTDVALLTYRARARWAHEASSTTVLASSTYVRRDGVWKLAFHQQTRVDDVGAAPRLAIDGRHADGAMSTRQASAAGAQSVGAVAFGAFALGATAIGALAIGRMAVGALAVKRARVKTLLIDDLQIRRVRIRDDGRESVSPAM